MRKTVSIKINRLNPDSESEIDDHVENKKYISDDENDYKHVGRNDDSEYKHVGRNDDSDYEYVVDDEIEYIVNDNKSKCDQVVPYNDIKFQDRSYDAWWKMHLPELNNTKFLPISENTGEIYCITNFRTQKVYIGQTKSYRINHGETVRFGSQKRFQEHIRAANKGLEECPKLNSSIRKHGERQFFCQVITVCSLEEMDDIELFFIRFYDSCKNGYNTIEKRAPKAPDNRARRVKIQETMNDLWKNDEVYIKKTTRANLKSIKRRVQTGETRTKHKLPHNIYKDPKGGYNIVIIRDNVHKSTSVQDKKKTDEDLLPIAIKKRDELMHQMEVEGVVERVVKNPDHNGNELPNCITVVKVYGIDGYRVALKRQYGGKDRSVEKTFTDQSLTMDQKLQKAIDEYNRLDGHFEEEVRKMDARIEAAKAKKIDHNGNELPLGICKYQQQNVYGVSQGYIATVSCRGKQKAKSVMDLSKTMDEKLQEVTDWLLGEGQTWLLGEINKREEIAKNKREEMAKKKKEKIATK